jgi:hypothetical protein
MVAAGKIYTNGARLYHAIEELQRQGVIHLSIMLCEKGN